jgi:hypothetical protein
MERNGVKEITRSRRCASLDTCISTPELDELIVVTEMGCLNGRVVYRLNRSAGSRNLHSQT